MLYVTKLKYTLPSGVECTTELTNPHGHPMEGEKSHEEFDIHFQAWDTATQWIATAYKSNTDEMIDDVVIRVNEVAYPFDPR